MPSHNLIPFLTEPKIKQLNLEIASRITNDYQGKVSEQDPLIMIVTLKGATFFAADLVRLVEVPLYIDFVRVKSYVDINSTGEIQFLRDMECSIENRHAIILDEIIDTGRTLRFLLNKLSSRRPKSLKVCSLLNKPSRREVPVDIDYAGIDVEDKFLVGYGLDFNEKYRHLKDIYTLEQ